MPCGENCLDCVNSTYCNPDKCIWEGGGGVSAFNHNGVCKTICPENSLPNSGTKKCEDCGSKCAICTSKVTNCTVCELGFYLEKIDSINGISECLAKCPAGKYPDGSNVCQFCPDECTLCEAASQCTQCKKPNQFTPPIFYYFVNFKCVETCPDRYYKDSIDVNDLFCRSCPSGCNQCNNENECTVCDLGWYLDTFKLEPLAT